MISRDGDNVGGREQPLVGVQVSGGHYSPEEPECPMTTEKAGGARTRLLLLLLSLAAVAGAYYFTGSESSPPMPTQAPPVASFPAPSSKPNGTSVPLPTPAAPDAKMSVATSSPVGIVKKITPLPNRLSIAPPPKPLSPAAVSGDTAPSQVASGPNATLAPPVSQLGSLPVPAAGKWVVEVGSFDDDSALGKVLQLLHSLGFEPQVSRVLHEVPMVRLRLGEYPSADVQRALATARRVAPDAFALPEGDQFTVYAGTYARRDNVHQMIERLSAKGIQVEEEPVLVKRTVSLVRIGNFADQAEAEEAATKVRSGGVRAKVAMPR